METAPVRRLFRSKRDRMLAGVCGGLGEYFDIDPVIVRLAFVVVSALGGSGLLIYIILAIVIPEEGREDRPAPGTTPENAGDPAATLSSGGEDLRGNWSNAYRTPEEQLARRQRSRQTGGLILIGLGLVFLLANLRLFFIDWDKFWPVVLIVLGLALLLNQRRR